MCFKNYSSSVSFGLFSDRFLSLKTKLQVYEVAENNVIDEAGHNASKAIHRLVSNLTESDVLIVLCTGNKYNLLLIVINKHFVYLSLNFTPG